MSEKQLGGQKVFYTAQWSVFGIAALIIGFAGVIFAAAALLITAVSTAFFTLGASRRGGPFVLLKRIRRGEPSADQGQCVVLRKDEYSVRPSGENASHFKKSAL